MSGLVPTVLQVTRINYYHRAAPHKAAAAAEKMLPGTRDREDRVNRTPRVDPLTDPPLH